MKKSVKLKYDEIFNIKKYAKCEGLDCLFNLEKKTIFVLMSYLKFDQFVNSLKNLKINIKFLRFSFSNQ